MTTHLPAKPCDASLTHHHGRSQRTHAESVGEAAAIRQEANVSLSQSSDVCQGRRFFCRDGVQAVALPYLELWQKAFPYRLCRFDSGTRLPAVLLRSAGNLNDPPGALPGWG